MHKVRGDPEKKLLMLLAAVFTALIMFGSHSVFASELGTDPLPEETAIVETIPEETATEPAPDPIHEETVIPPEETALEPTDPVTDPVPEEALPPEETVVPPEDPALEPAAPVTEPTEPAPTEMLPPEETVIPPEEAAPEPADPVIEPVPEEALLPEEALPPEETVIPPEETATEPDALVTEPAPEDGILPDDVTVIVETVPETILPLNEEIVPVPENLTEPVTEPDATMVEALPAEEALEIPVETVPMAESGAGLDEVSEEVVQEEPELVDPNGYVYDARTKLPIENATVTVYRTTDGGVNYTLYDNTLNGTMVNPQTTNAEGFYSYMVEAGFYKIVAGKEGYAEASMKFEQILSPEILFIHRIDFYLLPATSGWINFDGDVTITEDILLSGEDLVISSADSENPIKSITLAEDKTISTRVLADGVTDHETGASDGDSGSVTMTAPIITIKDRASIFTHADNDFMAGAITLTAEDTNVLEATDFIPVYQFDETITKIEIGEDVVMKGGEIVLLASSINEYKPSEDITNLESLVDVAVNTGLEKLESFNLFAAVSISKADADIAVGEGTEIIAETFSAKAESLTVAAASPLNFGIGVAVGIANSNADVVINGNITTSGDCYLGASTDNTLQVIGSAGGVKGVAFAVAVSVLNSNATVQTTETSNLTVGGNLNLIAETVDKNVTIARSKSGEGGKLGMSAAVSYENGTTNALLDGNAVVAGDIEVNATVVKESIDGSKLFGSIPSVNVGVCAQAGVNTGTYGSIFDDIQGNIIDQVILKATAIFGKIKDLVSSKSAEQQQTDKKTKDQAAPFEIAAAVAVYLDINHATARIGLPVDPLYPSLTSATVKSLGSVQIIATIESQPYITATGSVSATEEEPPVDPPVDPPIDEEPPADEGTKFAGSAAVAIGIFTNDARAFIAENASVDAAYNLIVKAESLNDFEFTWGLNLIQDAYRTYLSLGGKATYNASEGTKMVYTGDVVLKDDENEVNGEPGHHYMYMAEYDSGMVIYGQPIDLSTVDYNGSMWFDLGSLEQADTGDLNAEVKAGDIVEVLAGHKAGGDEGNLYEFKGSFPETLNLSLENFADETRWEDLGSDWMYRGGELVRTFSTYLDQYGLDNNLVNTWSQSTAKGAEVGMCGAVSVIDMNGTAEAYIDKNAKINQIADEEYRTGVQKVSVSSMVVNEAVHLGGNIEIPGIGAEGQGEKKSLKIKLTAPSSGDEAEKAAMGGTVMIISYDNVSTAMIYDGVVLYADELDVSADTSSFSFSFSASGGSAGTFAFNGTFSIIDINNKTWAGIENGARIVIGDYSTPKTESVLRIHAKDSSFIINLTGGIATSSSIGIGASIAIDEITRDTRAFIGNELLSAMSDGKPGEAEFTVIANGPVTIEAKNDGFIFSLALAAAVVKEKTTDPNKPAEPKSESKFGLGISAEVVINEMGDTAIAFVHDAAIKAVSLTMKAGNKTLIIGAGGSMSLVTTKGTSVGLAGSFAFNDITNITKSLTDNSYILLSGSYDSSADGSERIISICASGSASTSSNSASIAGQVSINAIGSQTAASIINLSEIYANNVKLMSKDNSLIFSIAGALAYGGKGGIGASIAFNDIPGLLSERNYTIASIESSDVDAAGFLDMDAETKGKIIAITAALGASKEGMAGALSVSVNTIIGDTKVFVSGKKTLGQDIEGAVTMDSIDDSYIFSLAGSLAASDKASFGIALSYNEIDKTVTSYLLDTKLDAASLTMKSSTDATIHNITAGGAVAKTLAAGGSVSINNIEADTETYIKNSEIGTVNSISLDATDNLKIGAISGTVAGAGKAAIGLAIATNNIGTSGDPNKVSSYIENSKVVSTAGGLGLSAVSNSVIKNITGAGTVAGDGGLSGAASINNVYSLIEAFIKDCNAAERYVRVLGDLIMKAEDHSTVSIISATIAVSGKVSAGAAVGTVNIGTVASPHVITANIDNSKVETTGGKAELTAKADAVIFNFTAGIAVGGNAGAQGSVSVNNVRTNAGAEIRNNSIVNAKNGVTLKAHASNRDSIPASAISAGDQGGNLGSLDMESDDDSEDDRRITTIQSLAGAVAGGGSGSIGAAVATNDVRMNVNAAIASSTVTSSDGQISIEGISEASIETLSAAIVITNYVAVAAGVSTNNIENDTNAYILNSTVTANYIETDPLKVSGIVLTAKDTSIIIAVAGQVNVAVSGGGLGAAAAFNEIANEVRAYVENSSLTSKSSLSLDADSDSEIKAVAAGGGFGLYVSLTGSIAKNTIANTVFSSIYNSTVSADKGVYLDSVNSSKISSLAGSLSTSAYAAIGGSVAINNIGCKSTEADDGYVENDNSNDNGTKVILSDIAPVGTKSWIENSRIISGRVVKLSASTDSMIKSISAAGGGALVAVNGAISMNNIYMDTESYIKDCIDALDPAVKLVSADNDIWIEAYDNSAVSVIAGNVSIGAVAAGAAVSTVNIGDGSHVNRTRAYIDNSRVTSTNGSINLKAMTNSFIFNIAAGISAGGTGIQGSVAVNNVTAKTSAEILNGSDVTAENSIVLEALIEKRETIPISMLQAGSGDAEVSSFDGNSDDNDGTAEEGETTHTLKTIQSLAGSVAGGGASGLGASVATNNVKNTVEASVKDSDVSSETGNVILTARSSASIETVSAAVAGGGNYAVAAAVSLNWIENSVLAFISDSDITSLNTSAYVQGGPVPGITINASDTSIIRSVAGQVSIAGTAGIGAGAAYNEIGNTVKAYADDTSILTSSGSILLMAVSDSTIETIAAGGSLSAGASVAGSAVINIVKNDTEAYMDHSTSGADGNVYILADSKNTINAFGGALAGGAIGVGAVAVVNDLENTTLAYSSYSDIKAKGTKEELDVKSWDEFGAESLVKAKGLFIVADCDDKVTVYSGSVSIAAGALSGQLSVTNVSDTTKAYIVASTINSQVEPGMWVKVKAHQSTEVDVRAGGLTIGTVAVGAALDHTSISNTTHAYIDKDSVTRSVVFGKDVEVTTDTLEDVEVIVAGASFSASVYISVSVSGSVSVALVDCDNKAYIADSDVTAQDKLSIIAYDIAKVSSTSYLLAASTFAGAGGTVSVNTIESSTVAENKGGNLKAYGAMEIKAVSGDTITTVLGTVGVGGAAGLAGAVSINTIESTTEAKVVKGAAAAWLNKGYAGSSQQTVKVSATNTSTIDGKGGSLGAGIAAGMGATVDVAAIRNRVVASVGLETEIYASGDITIEAISTKYIYSKVSSMAGGLLGVSGAVSVISIGDAMDKTAGDEFAITDDNGGSLLNQVSGDTQIGSMGLGSDGTSARAGSMLSTMEEPDISALVGTTANTEGKVTAAFIEAAASSAGRVIVKAGGKLTVKADSIVHIEASMDNLALGALGIGAVVAAVRTSEKTSAFIGDYADIFAGSLLIMAESNESATAEGKAATGGFLLGITANIANVSIKPTVKAYVGSNAYVFSKGDVEIAAIVTPKASAVVQGTTASAGVSVGVSSSTAKAEPDVSAWIGDYSKVLSGAILLNGNPTLRFMSAVIMSGSPEMTFKDNYVETIGTMTFAQDAVNGDTITRSSGSWIADGYNAKDGILVVRDTQTTQYVIKSVTEVTLILEEKGEVTAGTEDNIMVYSDRPDTITRSEGSWKTDGFEALQAITVGGSALNNGAYEIIDVTDTQLTLMQNYELKNEVKSGVTVTADTKDRIRRNTGSWSSDGFTAGQEIRVSGTGLNDGTYIVESVSETYLVLESNDRLTLEITAAAAFVIVDPEATKSQLTVSAIILIPESGAGLTANADAKASSGALLIGVSSTNALASTTSLVNAYTGTGVRIDAAGIAEINAYAYTNQKAIGTSKTGGILAVGGNTARVESTSTISAYTGTGLRIAADELRITAFGDEKNLSDSTSGTGGVVAGSVAKAETSSTSTTRAEIGNSAERISLIGLIIYADHTSRFDGKVDSTSASVLGKSGAEAINSVNATVTIKIGNVTIPAYNIVATAINSSIKDYIYGLYNAESKSGGGLADVPASRSITTISHTTGIDVANGAELEVIGDKYYPGSLALSALNSVYARDRVKLYSTGAIALAKASSKVDANALTAYVTIGDADLKSVGDIDLSARTTANIITDTFVHTSGGAGAAQGDSKSFVKAVNTITINTGANLFSEGEVNLLAGKNSAGDVNTYNLTSKTYLENYTALPVNTNPDAVAGFDQTNNVTVNTGAVVEAVKDANLTGETGITILESRGTGKDYYRSAVGAEIRYESTPMSSTGTITVNGEIYVGIRNKQILKFDSEGNVTEKSDGITFTITTELLSASIIAELDRLQRLRTQYAGTVAGAAFAQELAFRLEELKQQGYNVQVVTVGALTTYSIDLDVYVDVIKVDDIWAQSANINVIGTSFIGTGKLSAPGDAEITVQNSSPAFLIVNRLTIPETEGGYIKFNDENLEGTTPTLFNQNLNVFNRIKAAAFTSVEHSGTSNAPAITVVNEYTGSPRNPDITLLGTISNIGVSPRSGSVTISSSGSVYVRSDINAGTLNINASASMVQSYQDTFINVGGEVRVHYNSMTARQISITNSRLASMLSPLSYPGGYASDSNERAEMNNLLAVILSVANRQDAALGELRAANIFIAARYLNVNGLIEAGHAMQEAYLGSTIDTKITNYKSRGILTRNYLDYPLYQIADMKFYYDPVNDRIILDDVNVRGGYVELFGQIISTGTGRIKALDGFGTISVVNETLYSLAIKALDVGIGSHGTIKITDTSKQTKIGEITYYQITKYTRSYDTGTGKYTVTVKTWWSNTSEDAATTVVTNIADASSTKYQPTVGYRYVYVLGQDSGVKETYTYATSSWAGIDWLAKDPGSLYSHVIETYGTPLPLENGEYLAYDTANSSVPFMYWYESITQSERSLVSQRQWTTSGGFLGLKKTYWTEAIYRTYVKNVHYNSIKADYQIDIEFAGGLAGNISIVSDKDIVIMGPVTNALGTTKLDAGGSISQISSTAITSKDIELLAGTGIGYGQPVNVELKGGSLKAVTDAGDISILEIRGTLKLVEVSTGDGNVWLTAQTGIIAAASGTLIKGDLIELYAGSGSIGSGTALRVDTGSAAGSGMVAKADGSINLKETDGDMNILTIVSKNGNVNIEAVSGSLTDGDETERQGDNNGLLVVLRDNVTAGNLMDLWGDAGVATSTDSKYTPTEISALLAYALHKRLTDTDYRYELVNISGQDITLKATGGIGNLRTARIDFSEGKALLTEETMLMLAAAERGDVRFYDVNDLEVSSGSTNTAYIIITIHDDLDITSTGKLTVIAGGDSCIGSEEDIRIQTMTGQDTRIVSAKGVQSSLAAAGQNIVCGSLVIEAGSGAIGTEAKPIGVTSVSAGTERLAARSDDGIWLSGIAQGSDNGSFNLDFIYTPGAVSINAEGWIKDAIGDGFEKIVGASLVINADSIGEASGFVETDLLGGTMEIHAENGGIYALELNGDINALVIGTSSGDVILKAEGSILDAQTEGETKLSNILGRNIRLTATNGSIGTAGNHLEIDSANGGAGRLDADAKLDMFIDELNGSLSLGKLRSDSRIFISAPGTIVNAIGLNSGYNAEGLSMSFEAGGSAGTDAAPILMKVSELAGDAAGDVWMINDGALTVKKITDGKDGIDADGKVQITVRSPFTLESYIYSGGDTIIRTLDSASNDDITIAALAEIDSEGRIVLLSGDDIHILKTSIIEAVVEVVLFGDFNGTGYTAAGYSYTGDTDNGTGATIEILELPLAPSIKVYGGDDNDSFILTVDEAAGVISMYGKEGSDSFTINSLPSLISTFSGIQYTLTLDGEGAADTYTIYINNGQDVSSIINVWDTGTDSVNDKMNIFGTEDIDVFLLREKFIAILHADGPEYAEEFERINYNDKIEALDITSFGGDDRFYSDDNSAFTRIFSGAGDDFFQIGQMFKTDRVAGDDTGIDDGDEIKTIETTRGYLTPGNSFDMELYGGDGNDSFSVYANMKPLRLEGEEGNDRFILRAFALANPNDPAQGMMDVNSGTGDDYIEYNINAPVTINGGAGYDTVIAVGTELDDVFLVTKNGICGAGLNITIEGAEESFEAYGMEGDDIFHVQSTREGMVTRLVGGLGEDVFNLMGDVTEEISGTGTILRIVPHNLDTIQGPLYVEGYNYEFAPDFTLKPGVKLPKESSPALDVVVFDGDVKEADMKDRLYAFNDGTEIGLLGTMTSDNISGLGMGTDLKINEGTEAEPIEVIHKGGVTYTSLEIVELMLGSGDDSFTVEGTALGAITAIHGGGGADTITINGNSGPLVVYGDTSEDGSRYSGTLDEVEEDNANAFTNPGIDTIDASASSQGLTIYGGPGDDIINGSQGPDNIAGGSGADEIYGEDGNDIIFGDSGINADLEARTFTVITTEEASGDTLNGGAGNNIIFGDHGYITYVGMAQGIHKVSGPGTIVRIESTSLDNGGIDTLTGGDDAEILIGGPGADKIYGNGGDDVMLGDHGSIAATETLVTIDLNVRTDGGDDIMTGDLGADIMMGGTGGDDMTGGAGSNVMIGDHGTIIRTASAGEKVFGTAGIQSIATGLVGDGGIDIMTGGDDPEILIGGPGADKIYGNGGDDVMLGDHGDISVIEMLVTIDSNVRTDGGDEIMTGDLGADIMMGGTGGDDMTGGAGSNVMLGDHGTIIRTASGVEKIFGTAGIQSIVTGLVGDGGDDTLTGGEDAEILIGGPGADKIYGNGGDNIMLGDHGDISVTEMLVTIDLNVRTDGGDDIMTGDTGADIMMGGTGGDDMTGGAGSNVMLGDHGTISRTASAGEKVFGTAGIQSILTGLEEDGGIDTLTGGDDAEILIGGPGADKIYGNGGDDVMLGDHGDISVTDMLVTIDSHVEIDGDVDIMTGDLGADIMIGGTGGDDMTGGAGSNVMIGDHGTISRTASAGEQVIGTGGIQSIVTSLEGDGGDDTIIGGDDDDILIGGSGTDTITGNAGDDLIAGDNASLDTSNGDTAGNRYSAAAGPVYNPDGSINVGAVLGYPGDAPFWFGFGIELNHLKTAGNDYINGGAGEDMIFGQDGNDNIDGNLDDDYIEGGSGSDTIYGGLGQDDIIGGSSDLFGYELAEERSDDSDTIFGGEGTDTGWNTYGDGKNANDADVILGDNGNIYRLVGPDGYLKYGYDNYVGIRRLIPRVAELLDYTPGGPDYNSAASGDIGDADTIHGEAGDDTIYGMKGNDILYGEAGDDDIIGGWGHDWISGGTGDDGVLGDDGRIYTSRNGIAEPLYGIGVNAELYIEGTKSMTATIYKAGAINKTANLYPFNVDDMKDPFYDPLYADDIIYGGSGNDFLHGGSGDDAISGAEALVEFYNAPINIGDVLGYDAVTTLFAAYNPKAPMARVMVDESGKFVLSGGYEFLMNFDATEPDGNDMIFGDLGNDWLVGGPGMDWMFGGLGDDLLNADDDHNPLTDNTEVDFAPADRPTYYDDILFGGGGRDILIASSTGDVMVDWTGEYNSYVVPTSNFGPGTVIRYSTKDIVKFLYDLSEGAGSDTDAGSYIEGTETARNSEPYGEIGLVITGDPFDKDLVGAPRDPQPGNKGGKK